MWFRPLPQSCWRSERAASDRRPRHKRSTPLTMRAASMLGNTLSMMPRRAIMKSAPFAISALALGGGAPSAKADEPTYAPHFFYCIAE